MIISLLMALPPAISNVLLSHLVSNEHGRKSFNFQKLFTFVFMIFASSSIFIFLVSYIVLPILLPSIGRDIVRNLPYLLAGVVIFACIRVITMVFSWKDCLFSLFVVNGTCAVLSVFLPYLLIQNYGVFGLTFGWFISQIIGLFIAFFFLRKVDIFHGG
jgi:O-antigen/teichoic acid export membrane protein